MFFSPSIEKSFGGGRASVVFISFRFAVCCERQWVDGGWMWEGKWCQDPTNRCCMRARENDSGRTDLSCSIDSDRHHWPTWCNSWWRSLHLEAGARPDIPWRIPSWSTASWRSKHHARTATAHDENKKKKAQNTWTWINQSFSSDKSKEIQFKREIKSLNEWWEKGVNYATNTEEKRKNRYTTMKKAHKETKVMVLGKS